MIKRRNTIKSFFLVCGDLMLFYAALALTLFSRYRQNPDWNLISQHGMPFTLIFFLWLTAFGAFGLYDLKFMKNSKIFLYRLLRAMTVNTIIAIIFFYLFSFEIEPRRNLFMIAISAAVLIFVWRYVYNLLILKTSASKILFFGINEETKWLAEFLLANPQIGQRPIAFMAANGEISGASLPLPSYESSQDLKQIIQKNGIDTIVISSEIKENKTVVNMLFQAIPLGAAVIEFPSFFEMLTGKIPLSLIGEVWFLENLVGIKKGFYEFFKRMTDITVACLLSIPSLIVFPIIALTIKIDSEGPVFFRQKRVGKNGKEFWLVKYRSMIKNADELSGFKGDGQDPRHTRMGAFLRKMYLDELPQIINILRGEMSFVGPRPERPEYVKELKQKIPFYEMRLLVPPGITGWAQINMENDASVEDAPEKMQYDLYYVKNRSAVLDTLIILKTVFTILRRKGR